MTRPSATSRSSIPHTFSNSSSGSSKARAPARSRTSTTPARPPDLSRSIRSASTDSMSTPERQFADLLAAAPSRPFVTYYDEASGERSELSVKSLANWVAKTHHLLATELGLGVGDTALVALPAHWISVPILLGCLTAGLELIDDGATDVAFVSPQTASLADASDVYAIAPAAAAIGFRDAAPGGALDYVSAVRPQADAWPTVHLAAGPG